MNAQRCALRAIVAAAMIATSVAATAGAMTEGQVRARVDHHLRHVADLVGHFDTLVGSECPRFENPEAWSLYVDGEAERLVLLVAHLEQAWIEAKRSPDDELRRAAKAPRRQKEHARQLADKLSACATLNRASFSPLLVWQRVEREVPRRRLEIALPE